MAFNTRLRIFLKPLPSECAMTIQLNDGVTKYNKMGLVYPIAKKWATKQLAVKKLTTASSHYQDSNHWHRIHQRKGQKLTSLGFLPLPTKKETEEALDMIDVQKAKCFNCGRVGHLARDCKSPRKPQLSTARMKKAKQMLHAMVEGMMESEGEEVELEANEDGCMYYQNGRLVLDNELDQDPADEEVYMISCYEMNEEG